MLTYDWTKNGGQVIFHRVFCDESLFDLDYRIKNAAPESVSANPIALIFHNLFE